MTFLLLQPFAPEERWGGPSPYHYTTGRDRIAGGLFGGPAAAVREWAALYYRVLQQYVERGWFVGKDQNLMATLCAQHPTACSLAVPNMTAGENRWFTLWGCLLGERACAYNVRLDGTRGPRPNVTPVEAAAATARSSAAESSRRS